MVKLSSLTLCLSMLIIWPMKLIEHLDHVIGLLDAGKPPSEIKGSLIATRDQIEAYEKGAAELATLKESHPKEIAELKAAQTKEIAELKAAIAKLEQEKGPAPKNSGSEPRIKNRTSA